MVSLPPSSAATVPESRNQSSALAPAPPEHFGTSAGLPKSMPSRLAIFNNIRATQETPRGKTELFYGASSPFSVLQHLDAHLPMQGAPAVYQDPAVADVQNGDRSIRSYNYQHIVFDQIAGPIMQSSGLQSPSYASAKIALRNFLVTACPRLPFLDSNNLCAVFERLYGATRHVSDAVVDAADKALVLAALGMGAFPLIDLPHREVFLAQARAEAVSIMYDINTKTVQATLMLAQLELETGRPNICYLQLGGAIRKAFAAGVHRSDTLESKQTMQALYCNESLICFVLGKHSSLTDEDIEFPQAQDSSLMAYFIRLCAIVRSAHRIYHLDDTVAADLTAAEVVRQELRDFATALKDNTRLEIGCQLYTLTGEDLAWHVTLSYAFNATKLLLDRPFLLLCLELKRRGVRDIRRERNGGVEMAVVYEAASRSVSAAHDIIDFCDSLFSLQIGAEGFYTHGIYLECACFVLALASVHRSAHLPPQNLDKLCTGLRLLRRIGSHEPIRSTSAAVEQMIDRIRALEPTTQIPASEGQQPPSSDNSSDLTGQPTITPATLPAFDLFQESLTPVGWDEDLADLWSMMDCNVGFPSLESSSATMPGL